MIGLLVEAIPVAIGFGAAYSEYQNIKNKKAADKKAKNHRERMAAVVQSILDDKEILPGPAEDSFTIKGMYFGTQVDTGLEVLTSQREDIAFTRIVKAEVGEYKYSSEDEEYEDKSILKAMLQDQRKRGTDYVTYLMDQGLKPADNIVLWYLEMLV